MNKSHAFFLNGYPVSNAELGNELMSDLAIWMSTLHREGYELGHESYTPVATPNGTVYMSIVVRMEKDS